MDGLVPISYLSVVNDEGKEVVPVTKLRGRTIREAIGYMLTPRHMEHLEQGSYWLMFSDADRDGQWTTWSADCTLADCLERPKFQIVLAPLRPKPPIAIPPPARVPDPRTSEPQLSFSDVPDITDGQPETTATLPPDTERRKHRRHRYEPWELDLIVSAIPRYSLWYRC